MKSNNEIRCEAKRNGVKHWEVAARMGVSEQTFVRWMRTPMCGERTQAALDAIHAIAREKEGR